MEKNEINDFVKKQIKDSMAKIQGALNLLDNNKPWLARNKLVGLNQKLGYIYNRIEELEKQNEKDNNIEGDKKSI